MPLWEARHFSDVRLHPIIDADIVLDCLRNGAKVVDKVKIGKLNYHKSDINWHDFGVKAEKICKEQGVNNSRLKPGA